MEPPVYFITDRRKIYLYIFSSFFFFLKKLPIVVMRLSSVEIISFRGNSLSNRPIDLKIGLNVREEVVHVRNSNCKLQTNLCAVSTDLLTRFC